MGITQRYGFAVLLDMATECKESVQHEPEQSEKKHLDLLGILLDVMRRFQAHSIVLSKVQVAVCAPERCLFRDRKVQRAGAFSTTLVQCICCEETSQRKPEEMEVVLDLEPDWSCLKR
uniref:Uncharacterized protein n=1 Tax=Caenorhabditis japonica TaxID=281687 RepID=A0A8R1E5P0_CAEJA